MKSREIEFTLPLGYEDEKGNYHRTGRMRLATALDEIEAHSDEKVLFNKRYRDCILLSQVITELGELPTVGAEVVENMFEVDFLYLQMLYNKLNSDQREFVDTICPECQASNRIQLPNVFKELHKYFAQKEPEIKE